MIGGKRRSERIASYLSIPQTVVNDDLVGGSVVQRLHVDGSHVCGRISTIPEQLQGQDEVESIHGVRVADF